MRDGISDTVYRRGRIAVRRALRPDRLLAGLALLVLAAGCGGSPALPATTATVLPTEVAATTIPVVATATTVPIATVAITPTTGSVAGGTAVTPAYAHSQDYAMIAGQLHHQVSCWVVTYVSPLTAVAADQYNNQLSLVPGAGWDETTVKDGQWVIVQGHVDPSAPQGKAPSCGVTGYAVDSLTVNPHAP
jgi:hypothetical protein